MKSRNKLFFFSFFTTVLILLGVEGLVRLGYPYLDARQWQARLEDYYYASWNQGQILLYRYDPNFNFRLVPNKFRTKSGAEWEINQLGLRGPLPSLEKPEGTIRIVVLGGSSVFNGSLKTGLTWPDLLKQELEKLTGRKIEIINGATPGYTSYQSARRLKFELIDYHPDLVLVYHLWNDLKRWALKNPEEGIEQWEQFAQSDTPFPLVGKNVFLDRLSRYSQAVAYLRLWILKQRLKALVQMQEGIKYQRIGQTINPRGPEFYRKNLQLMIDTVKPYSIPLVIIKQATLVRQDSPPEVRKRIHYEYAGLDHQTLVQAYQIGWRLNDELCREPGVYCLDANQVIPPTLEYFEDQVHLKDRGREVLARYLAEALIKLPIFEKSQNPKPK